MTRWNDSGSYHIIDGRFVVSVIAEGIFMLHFLWKVCAVDAEFITGAKVGQHRSSAIACLFVEFLFDPFHYVVTYSGVFKYY